MPKCDDHGHQATRHPCRSLRPDWTRCSHTAQACKHAQAHTLRGRSASEPETLRTCALMASRDTSLPASKAFSSSVRFTTTKSGTPAPMPVTNKMSQTGAISPLLAWASQILVEFLTSSDTAELWQSPIHRGLASLESWASPRARAALLASVTKAASTSLETFEMN